MQAPRLKGKKPLTIKRLRGKTKGVKGAGNPLNPGHKYAWGGAGLGKKRGREEVAGVGPSEGSRNRVGAEGKGTGGSGGRRDGGDEQLLRTLVQEQVYQQMVAPKKPPPEKPHVGQTCGNAFLQAGSLARRMRTRSGETAVRLRVVWQGVLAGRESGCAHADSFGGEAASVILTSVNLVMGGEAVETKN